MAKDHRQPDSLSANRRDFFRKILLKGLDKVENSGKSLIQRVEHAIEPAPGPVSASYAPAPPDPTKLLRPPGALPEKDLAQTCEQCGKCVEACPADAIQLDTSPAQIGDGLPYIIARQAPCVICTDLACMPACPTGALVPVERPEDIRMGLAIVDHERCLRRPDAPLIDDQQEDCQICVTQCPIGASAIGIEDQTSRIEVKDGCTGCGVCERECPTLPASIVVEPRVDANTRE